MKILIVGGNFTWSLERLYLQYLLESRGVDAQLFPSQNMFLERYERSTLTKVMFRCGLSRIYDRINKALIEQVTKWAPDIVWIFKGMEIYPSTLERFRSMGIYLANYNPDNPFLFSGRGSGNSNITGGIRSYHLHLTYDRGTLEALKSRMGLQAELLPFGFDPSENWAKAVEMPEPEVSKLCFVGNGDQARVAFIRELAQRGIAIDVYGSSWEALQGEQHICLKPAVFGLELLKTLRKYRLQLNLMRLHNPMSHNMRTFEVPSVGGLLLAPDTLDHREFFQADQQIFLYRNTEECVAKTKHVLGMPKSMTERFRGALPEFCMEQGYSYRSRTAFVLKQLEALVC